MENQEKLEVEVNSVEEKIINKPTEEEIEQFKQNYETLATEFNSTKYQIGDETNCSKFLDILLHYVEFNAPWTGNMWKGIPLLFKELNEIKDNNSTVINLSYQALEFTHAILSNPSGVGLASAMEIEKVAEELTEIFNIVNKLTDEVHKTLKNIQHTYDIYLAGLQGFYLEKLTDNLETNDETVEETCECGDSCKCSKDECGNDCDCKCN